MSYNIAQEIIDFAEQNVLGFTSTGGGCDYVNARFHNGMEAILTCPYGDGSPLGLNSPAHIMVFQNDEWESGINIEFATARAAMLVMATMTSFNEDALNAI